MSNNYWELHATQQVTTSIDNNFHFRIVEVEVLHSKSYLSKITKVSESKCTKVKVLIFQIVWSSF